MARLGIIILLIFFSIGIQTAKADPRKDFIRIDCNRDLNFLLIERIYLDTTLAQTWTDANKSKLLDKHSMMDLDDLFSYSANGSSQSTKSVTKECTLSKEGKPVKYDMTIEGYAVNGNPAGMCGLWHSFTLTLKRDNQVIIDRIHFDQSCQSESAIYQISLSPEQAYLNMTGVGLANSGWFDNDFPLTHEKTYQPEPKTNP